MGKQYCPVCFVDQEMFVNGPGGTVVCTKCGAVLEENTIVSEISFGESGGGGAATMNGSNVNHGETRARTGGSYKQGGGQESREQTLYNGKKKLLSLSFGLNLSERISDSGNRYFNLAVNMNFVQGRRTEYVVAACLYSACRFNKTSHMLIDFSDLLQINVFVLGATYLKLVKELSLNLPTIDPSLYISRFAALLEFGDETQKVAADAVRLVSRMGRDWMHIGRRPSGICGAALLLAARMNNFRRSITEVVQVVKIADVTLRKRLGEFKDTASGELTVDQFRTVWLDEQADPPAFSQAQKRDKVEREKLEELGDSPVEQVEAEQDENGEVVSEKKKGKRKERAEESPEELEKKRVEKLLKEPVADSVIESELTTALGTGLLPELSNELGNKEKKQFETANSMTNLNSSNDLDDLDESELDCFILTPAEVEAKSRLWMEFNKDYLQALADKQTGPNGELKVIAKPKPRKKPKLDNSGPATSAAEATKQMMVKKRFSKKINYNAIDSLFNESAIIPEEGVATTSGAGGSGGSGEGKAKKKAIVIARPTFTSSRANSRGLSIEPTTEPTQTQTQARPNDTQEEEPIASGSGSGNRGGKKVVEEEEEEADEGWRKAMGVAGDEDEENFGYDAY